MTSILTVLLKLIVAQLMHYLLENIVLLDQSEHYALVYNHSLIRAQNSDLNHINFSLKPSIVSHLSDATILQCKFIYLRFTNYFRNLTNCAHIVPSTIDANTTLRLGSLVSGTASQHM